MSQRLGVGFIGSGFITDFHVRSFVGIRGADVRGVWSPTPEHAEAMAARARELGVGDCRAFRSIGAMAADAGIDALWICGPNHARVANVREIVEAVAEGAHLRGVCCEKPLARTSEEAREVLELVERAGLLHGYLENQVFTPSLVRGRELVWQRGAAAAGRPFLARAAEEHGGPHEPWFWQKSEQGGGVLLDMLCHSVEAGRYLLTRPGAPRDSVRVRSVTAQTRNLKWTRPDYAQQLATAMPGVDYTTDPAEDFARASFELEDDTGLPLMLECTTSWSYTGPGLRLSFELQGPEYSLQIDSLNTPCRVFFSRGVSGEAGEDLVEKQNAEQGLMPVLPDEPAWYGYEAQNRHMVRSFLAGSRPRETWDDGVAVVDLLMACYRSARERRTLDDPLGSR